MSDIYLYLYVCVCESQMDKKIPLGLDPPRRGVSGARKPSSNQYSIRPGLAMDVRDTGQFQMSLMSHNAAKRTRALRRTGKTTDKAQEGIKNLC